MKTVEYKSAEWCGDYSASLESEFFPYSKSVSSHTLAVVVSSAVSQLPFDHAFPIIKKVIEHPGLQVGVPTSKIEDQYYGVYDPWPYRDMLKDVFRFIDKTGTEKARPLIDVVKNNPRAMTYVESLAGHGGRDFRVGDVARLILSEIQRDKSHQNNPKLLRQT